MIVDQLREAARYQYPVRIDRGRGAWGLESVYGFVVSVSRRWVAVQSFVDSVHFDGYEVVRIGDVIGVADKRTNGYVERVIGVLGRPEVDFSLPADATTREVLGSATEHSSLVRIHFEMELDDPMFVGSIVQLGARKYEIQRIDTSGVWESEPTRWWYGEVTRIGFGDRYSATLQRFGDKRPTQTRSTDEEGWRAGVVTRSTARNWKILSI